MSSENETLVNTNGSMKRHHSIENFDPVKEAKIEKTPQKHIDGKSKEVTNGHHETKSNPDLLEKGDIVFMYKPKLGVDESSSIDDVQLFHVLLIPETDEQNQGDQVSKTRLIKIGKKKLPAAGKDRFWAFIEKADDDIEKVEENLEAQSYETATVGTRTVKADRIAGKGKYLMAKHDQNRTIIGYVLESPSELGDVQNAFNITKEASFSLAVKNPKKKNPPAVGLTSVEKPEFPEEIQNKFGSYQWLPAEPAMLDIPGCEMVWIGSSADESEGLLEELNREIEEEEEEEVDPETKATEVMKDIQLDEKQHPTQALIDGQWPKVEDAPEKQDENQTKIDDFIDKEEKKAEE